WHLPMKSCGANNAARNCSAMWPGGSSTASATCTSRVSMTRRIARSPPWPSIAPGATRACRSTSAIVPRAIG
ncbi:MAG: hypothetical protein AVDCRST_MAG42-2325, partial [uncultured Chthoniobacterales bacterium]